MVIHQQDSLPDIFRRTLFGLHHHSRPFFSPPPEFAGGGSANQLNTFYNRRRLAIPYRHCCKLEARNWFFVHSTLFMAAPSRLQKSLSNFKTHRDTKGHFSAAVQSGDFSCGRGFKSASDPKGFAVAPRSCPARAAV
jgi:hypothetical protein